MPDINKTDLVAWEPTDAEIEAGVIAMITALDEYLPTATGAAPTYQAHAVRAILKAVFSATIEAQAAEISRLRDALKPFAEILKGNYSHQRDDLPISAGFGRDDLRFVLSLGDFRRARTALEEANHG